MFDTQPSAANKGKKGDKKKGDKKKEASSKKLTQALDSMPEALRGEILSIMDDVAKLDSSEIQKRYDIGHRLNTMITDKSGKYGVDAKRSIGAVLRLSKDSVAGMVNVAKQFGQTDLEKMTKLENPVTRERLRWHHIVFLARVPDKDKAFTFAQKAIDQGWTTKDLGKQIIRSGGGAKSAGGRPPKRHASLEQSLNDVIARLKSVSNAAESVWLAPNGLTDQFNALVGNPEGWTPAAEQIRQLAEAVDEGHRLSVQAAALNATLMGLKARAESIRAVKKKAVA